MTRDLGPFLQILVLPEAQTKHPPCGRKCRPGWLAAPQCPPCLSPSPATHLPSGRPRTAREPAASHGRGRLPASAPARPSADPRPASPQQHVNHRPRRQRLTHAPTASRLQPSRHGDAAFQCSCPGPDTDNGPLYIIRPTHCLLLLPSTIARTGPAFHCAPDKPSRGIDSSLLFLSPLQ